MTLHNDEGSYFDSQLALLFSAPRVPSSVSQRLCGRPPWYFLLRCYHVLSSVPPLVHQSTSESLPEFPVRSSDTIRVPVGGFYHSSCCVGPWWCPLVSLVAHQLNSLFTRMLNSLLGKDFVIRSAKLLSVRIQIGCTILAAVASLTRW